VVCTHQLGAGGAVGRLKSTGVHTADHEFLGEELLKSAKFTTHLLVVSPGP